MFKKLSIAIALFFMAGTAQAYWIGDKSIVGIDIGDTGQMIIRLDSHTQCNSPFIYIESWRPWYKEMFALANSAFMANKKINGWVNCAADNRGEMVRMFVGPVY